MTRHIVGWLLIVTIVPVLTASLGCGVRGDRAATGECPDGEVCSDATPSGLVFRGTSVSGMFLGGSNVSATAVGGTQRVRISTLHGETLPLFDAESSNPAIEIADISGAGVMLRGVADGASTLRLTERDGGGLLDRTTVRASPVAGAIVAPALDLLIMLAPEPRPSAFEPGQHTIAVRLVDASERVVIDEGMRLDAGVPSTTTAWDSIELVVPAGGLDVTVDAAGGRFVARVPVASAIDDIELATWILDQDASGRTLIGPGSILCAIGLAGGARVVTAASTAPATFTIDGVALASDETSAHCARAPEDLPAGAHELVIALGGARRTFAVTSDEPSGAATGALALPGSFALRSSARSLGDRARALDAR